MLVKPTITLMLIASVVSSALLVFVPWDKLLGNVNLLYLPVAAVLGVFIPIPIALDVMFAGQLYQQGVNSGYVMLFLTTLGTYSIIPTVYLWREVSHALAVIFSPSLLRLELFWDFSLPHLLKRRFVPKLSDVARSHSA